MARGIVMTSLVDAVVEDLRNQVVSGALATAGGLLFYGESNGDFVARDVDDGKPLWRFATGAGVNAPAITYAVDGRQYVAVAAGGHALFNYPQGDTVIAFALLE